MGKRLKLGDIYEINLPNRKNAYGRLFKEFTLGIYNGLYQDISELPCTETYFRYITVYKNLLQDGKWKIVGHRDFSCEDEAWPPPRCIVDAITKVGSLYIKGKIVPCSYDECKDLEIVTVWDRQHVVDMLMGKALWDMSIRKPQIP